MVPAIIKISSKLMAIILLSLLFAPMMIAVDHRALARITAMSADQLIAHERHILGRGLAYHFMLIVFSLTFCVAIIDGASWCIRAPFLHWAKQAANLTRISTQARSSGSEA
jgi:hypothetical protein